MDKFLKKLYLYETPQEAFWKVFLITISWRGGVHFQGHGNEAIGTVFATSLFIFSISLIMEYIEGMFKDSVIEKIFPAILTLVSIFTVIVCISVLMGNPFVWIKEKHLYYAMNAMQYILWADCFIQLFFSPKKPSIETTLIGVKVEK